MDSTRMTEVHGLMGRITAAQTLGSAGWLMGRALVLCCHQRWVSERARELLGATMDMGLVPKLGEEMTGEVQP